MNLIEKLKQNALSGDSCQGVSEDMAEAAKLIDALLGVIECFGSCEATWYENEWRYYGITPEMREKINAEYQAREKRALANVAGEPRAAKESQN